MSQTIDSRQMQAFVAVARKRSFTLAAKELHITQSAVSHALKALEDDLGCRLFDRVGRGVCLTYHGEQFLRRAELVLREMDRVRIELKDLTNWEHGRLRVGASTTACQYILPTALREFMESFPRSSLRIEGGDQPQQIELLRQGTIDLAVTLAPEDEHDLEVVPLFSDELRFLVGPMHPWATMEIVPADQISSETLLLPNRGSLSYSMIQEYFKREGVAVYAGIQPGSNEALKELAKVGVGAAVLSTWLVRDDIAKGRLVALPMGSRPLVRQWGVVYLAKRRLTLGEETFIGLCRSVVETLSMGREPPKKMDSDRPA
jgi:DNA-binding transcriptional LysR family regulator